VLGHGRRDSAFVLSRHFWRPCPCRHQTQEIDPSGALRNEKGDPFPRRPLHQKSCTTSVSEQKRMTRSHCYQKLDAGRLTTAVWRVAFVLAAMLSGPASADTVPDFYRGKQVTLVVGYGTGGGYDVYARLLARYLSRHIPGSPNVIVQNMPSAGSLRAANYLYANAPKDGTQIGTFARDMPLLVFSRKTRTSNLTHGATPGLALLRAMATTPICSGSEKIPVLKPLRIFVAPTARS
jgi:hypothetical protein